MSFNIRKCSLISEVYTWNFARQIALLKNYLKEIMLYSVADYINNFSYKDTAL